MYVDAVLGLSVTPSAVGLVLVEGLDADGATMDRDAFEVRSGRHSNPVQTCERAAAAVLRTEAIAATRGHRLHSIGVTWSDDADAEASLLLKSLSDSGFGNVVPVRLPDATEALARGIAEVIGYDTTAVCVVEPETVIVLIVRARDGAVQTAINHAIDTDERLIRWLSGVFTRADWQPEALVVVGSAGDLDFIMPALEDALSVPVFAPAEAQLALARGAALASAQTTEFGFDQHIDGLGEQYPQDRRRRPIGQSGPAAMLVAGVLTFVVSVSAALSLQLAPKKDSGPGEPRPAANAAPETPAAVPHAPPALPPPVAIPSAPIAKAPAPPPAAAPVEVARPGVDVPAEPPAYVPEAPAAGADAPVDVPAAGPVAPAPPDAAAPLQPPPPSADMPTEPVPVQRPGILHRIKERLHGISGNDGVEQAPAPAPPPPEVPPLPPQ
jgi:hypothetical protein